MAKGVRAKQGVGETMKLKAATLMAVFAVVAFLAVPSVQAGGPIRKLGRGIANAGFGALEIPIVAYDVNQEEGGIAACTYGVLKGVALCVAREVVGIVDIVTFLIPLPGATGDPHITGEWGYGPLMYPEFVVDEDHDIYNIVYQDLPVE